MIGPAGESGDYWNTAYGANSEVYVTIATKPATSNDLVALGLRYQNPGAANSSGYQAVFINQATGTDQYRIWVAPTAPAPRRRSRASPVRRLVAGDTLLFRAIGPNLELWRKSGGTWTKILSGTDGTITSGGYLALIAKNTVVRLDNFGGGTLP